MSAATDAAPRTARGPDAGVRRAVLAGLALYLLQGVPVLSVLLVSRIGSASHDNAFTVIPYWTGAPYLVAVVVFGLVPLVSPAFVRAWTTAAAARCAAAATFAFLAVSCVPAVAAVAAAHGQDAGFAAGFYSFTVPVSVTVGAGIAAGWAWRTRRSTSVGVKAASPAGVQA